MQLAGPLPCSRLANGQQAGQPRPGGLVGWIDQQAGATGKIQPTAGDQTDAGFLGRLPGAHDPGYRIAIDDAQCRYLEPGGLSEQFVRGGHATQEGEMRGDLKFDIILAHHPNTPWMCQERSPDRRFSPSPRRNTQKRSPRSFSTRK